jgi:acyl-coenzyme A synthetase/AMP-(fatty) acid ligase
MINLPFTNDTETELIITAKEVIRKGRFQNLQRDINKLKRAVGKSPLKPVIILERIIAILRSYPLVNEGVDEVEQVQIITSKVLNPEIIITESYT